MFISIKKNNLKSISLLLVMAFIITYVIVYTNNNKIEAFNESTNWGLSFQKDGEAPIGNATSTYLKKYNSYFVEATKEKVIHLTFDCGYENGFTPKILDVLKAHNVKATFFVVGNYLETSPDIVKRMCDEGHIVGNHTYHHPDMSKISDLNSFKSELEQVEKKYKEITGKDMLKYYRPPQGIFSESNLSQANELGYKTIFWSLAYVDWYVNQQPSREQAFNKLLPRIHPGAIVLLHSTSSTNADILDELLTKWEQQGYKFKNIDEL